MKYKFIVTPGQEVTNQELAKIRFSIKEMFGFENAGIEVIEDPEIEWDTAVLMPDYENMELL